jgi:hypothetical protein
MSREFSVTKAPAPHHRAALLRTFAAGLLASRRRLPNWRREPDGLIQEVPPGPVATSEPLQDITLVPLRAARLPISAFPGRARRAMLHSET